MFDAAAGRAVVSAVGRGIGRAVAGRFVAEGSASDLDAKFPGSLEGIGTASPDPTDAVVDRFAGLERIDALVHAVGHSVDGQAVDVDDGITI